jgi:hypothetical protein
MNHHSTRQQQVLVSRAFIEKHATDPVTYSVPSVSSAEVTRRVALYHASVGNPVIAHFTVTKR